MSALGDSRSLAGYTLDDVLANNKRRQPPGSASAAAEIRNRTLLDIIRDEGPGASKGLFGHKDKRTWKSFRDKLRLKRAGSAWVSTVPIPTSDMPVHGKRSLLGKRNQVRFDTVSPRNSGELTGSQIEESSKHRSTSDRSARQNSTNSSNDSIAFELTRRDDSSENSPSPDAATYRIIRPPLSRHNSVRVSEMEDGTDPTEPERDHRVRQTSTAMAGERTMSAREAVVAQEAADAAAAAAEAAEEEDDDYEDGDDEDDDENDEWTTGSEASGASQPLRMSLMDLLQETDREMGWEASSYINGDDDDDDDEEFYEEDEEEEEEEEEEDGVGGEVSCCACMARRRGAVIIQCGHTFCRMCSKDLMVSRGNCPTCNDFMLEIIQTF